MICEIDSTLKVVTNIYQLKCAKMVSDIEKRWKRASKIWQFNDIRSQHSSPANLIRVWTSYTCACNKPTKTTKRSKFTSSQVFFLKKSLQIELVLHWTKKPPSKDPIWTPRNYFWKPELHLQKGEMRSTKNIKNKQKITNKTILKQHFFIYLVSKNSNNVFFL